MEVNDTIVTAASPSCPSPPASSISPLASPPAIVASSPCAACKILRRKCADKCVLAPYFPPVEPLKFITAHKVFGASNISKLLQVIWIITRWLSMWNGHMQLVSWYTILQLIAFWIINCIFQTTKHMVWLPSWSETNSVQKKTEVKTKEK